MGSYKYIFIWSGPIDGHNWLHLENNFHYFLCHTTQHAAAMTKKKKKNTKILMTMLMMTPPKSCDQWAMLVDTWIYLVILLLFASSEENISRPTRGRRRRSHSLISCIANIVYWMWSHLYTYHSVWSYNSAFHGRRSTPPRKFHLPLNFTMNLSFIADYQVVVWARGGDGLDGEDGWESI